MCLKFPNNLTARQHGAALLAFMLIMIAGTSYLLVSRMNANLIIVSGEHKTRLALEVARQALIGYAVTYPDAVNPDEGPGYLPCPDTDRDGDAESNCSDAGNTTIGRLPYKTLELPELKDSSGQELWYAISENFRYGANKIIPLNSESPAGAQLTVDTSNDIVAVIIAPGRPLDTQSRNPSQTSIVLEINEYLEGDNADLDRDFVTTLGNSLTKHVEGERNPAGNNALVFNDNLVFITRQELMAAVEKRVIGEVKSILANYKNTHGKYPWMTPFADPKSSYRKLSGTHNGASGSANLTDTSRDFTEWDIQDGDIVSNLSDGSIATVAIGGVSGTTLVLNSLSLGVENDFDADDQYVIFKQNWIGNPFTGTATAGTSNLTLADTTKDFRELGISVGDIVENLSDVSGPTWSSGTVDSVSSTQITVKSLTGGASNTFSFGDSYVVRNNAGQTTGPNNSTSLADSNKNFTVMGVRAGDIILNITDGSIGRVASVSTTTTLLVDDLIFGTDNDFDTGDYYYLPRFNTDSNSRRGLLSFHEEGQLFPTAFDVNWNITVNAGDVTFDSTVFPGVQAAYSNALVNYLQTYSSAGTRSFDISDGTCMWFTPEIADCYGGYEDFVNISGRITSGLNTNIVTDSSADFTTDGIKRGDLAENYDDESLVISGTADAGSTGTILIDASADFSIYEPYSFVIQNNTQEIDEGQTKIQGVIAQIIDANTLIAEPYVGEGSFPIEFDPGDNYAIYQPQNMVVTNVSSSTALSTLRLSPATPDFDTGEYYRVKPATKSFGGVVDSGTATTLTDASANFRAEGISPGDIIENITDNSFGVITAVTTTTITATLYNGTLNSFAAGNNYTIYHNYVFSRQHEFHARFRGSLEDKTVTEKKVRDVCLGYTSDCSALSTPVAFSGNGGVPLITIRDYEYGGIIEVGRATFTPSISSTGSLRVANIDYYLAGNGGAIPVWFLKNNWHHLVYIALSPGDVPGAAAACTAGSDCLTLSGAGAPDDDKQALVISAGEETQTELNAICNAIAPVMQSRSSGEINDYFEMENCNPDDDIFQHAASSNTYNDQSRVIE